MNFATFVDVVILIAAFLGAVAAIYNFFFKAGKGVKKKVDTAKEEQEKEFNKKVEERAKQIAKPMVDAAVTQLRSEFEGLLDEYLPDRLTAHDHETRAKYLADRQRYLGEIKDEVVHVMQDKINTVDTHEEQMTVFTEVLKELLRERIMAIYRRNRQLRQLEEHERLELLQAYNAYKSIKGNSYIDGYYKMMKEWEIVPDEHQ